jgi:hypothetical protein
LSIRSLLKNPYLRWLIKVLLSAAALYLVYRKINPQDLWDLRKANALWLIITFLLFNLSQWVSAFRHAYLLESISIRLDFLLKIKLYYVGMFYNLFLPGGIGGDGYKIFYLQKRDQASVKKLIFISLFDRGLGLIGLLVLGAVGHYFLGERSPFNTWSLPLLLMIIPAFLIFFWVIRRFYSYLNPYVPVSLLQSFLIQGLQGVSALTLAMAVGADPTHYLGYVVIFYISSVATIIPVTVGGLGLREITLLYGCQALGIPTEPAVAIGLLFFLITALSSLAGIALNLPSVENKKS